MSALLEHSRGENLRQADIDWFAANGVTGLHLAKTYREFSFILVDKVAFLSEQRFEFAHHLRGPSDVVTAYTMLLRDVQGHCADVLAWHPRTGRIATWRGAVSVMGEEQIEAPRLDHLMVHDGVLPWLRDGRRGLAVIDPVRAAQLLYGAGPLLVPSVELGKRLKRQLTIPAPEILVYQPQEVAA